MLLQGQAVNMDGVHDVMYDHCTVSFAFADFKSSRRIYRHVIISLYEPSVSMIEVTSIALYFTGLVKTVFLAS